MDFEQTIKLLAEKVAFYKEKLLLLQQQVNDLRSVQNSPMWRYNFAVLDSLHNLVELWLKMGFENELPQQQTKKKEMDPIETELQAIKASNRGSCSSEGLRNTTRDKVSEFEAMKVQLAPIKTPIEDGTKICNSSSDSEQDIGAHGETAMAGITKDIEYRKKEYSDASRESMMKQIKNQLKEEQALQSLQFAYATELLRRFEDSDSWKHGNMDLPKIDTLKQHGLNLAMKELARRTKKKQMDHLVAEVQAIKASCRGSAPIQDGTKICDFSSDPKQDIGANGQTAMDGITEDMSNVSLENRNSDANIKSYQVIGEIDAQIEYLNARRAKWLSVLKQPLSAATQPASSNLFSRPLPALIPLSEKKWGDNANTETQSKQAKISRLEDLIRKFKHKKEATLPSNMNRDVQELDQNSQRSSGSQASHTSTLGNIWPSAAGAGGSNEQTVDGVSTSENLLNIGLPAAIKNGGIIENLCACPIPPSSINQGQTATDEHSLQQILWRQQCELQSMHTATAKLQLQSRNQALQRVSNAENQEEHSNLSRSIHNLGDALDATLPPSSSLPNLVPLANFSVAFSHLPVVSSSNSQQQQQQQLNKLLNNLSLEMKEDIISMISLITMNKKQFPGNLLKKINVIIEDHELLPHFLKSLNAFGKQFLNNPWFEAPDLTPSESCQSTEDSDVSAALTLENHGSMVEIATASHVDAASSSASFQVPLIEHSKISGASSLDCASAVPSVSNTKPSYNEDLAEADQSKPESSGNQKLPISDINNEKGQEEAASYPISAEAATPDLESLAAKTEDERAEDTGCKSGIMFNYTECLDDWIVYETEGIPE